MSFSNRVAETYLAAEGLRDGFVRAIDPRDEMFLTLGAYGLDDPSQFEFQYFHDGREAALTIETALAAAGKEMAAVGALLEFACGFGRVTRHLVQRIDPDRIWSCDIQADGVRFVRDTFAVNAFESARDPASLALDRRFDVIFVGSFFSHLPRWRFAPWLARLVDALSDDGVLILTTHGAGAVPGVEKDPSGYTFVAQSESDRLAPDEYGSAYITPEQVHRLAGDAGVGRIRTAERDLWWIQDVHLAARRDRPGLDAWIGKRDVRGHIDVIRIDADRQAWFGGWAAVRSGHPALTDVRVWLDGADVAPATIAATPPGSAGLEDWHGWTHSTFSLHGPVPPLPNGEHALAVAARDVSGRTFAFDARGFIHADGAPFLYSRDARG